MNTEPRFAALQVGGAQGARCRAPFALNFQAALIVAHPIVASLLPIPFLPRLPLWATPHSV